MSYFLPCGTQEELWLPFPFYTLESLLQPLQRIIATGQCQVQSSVWRLAERAGDEGCGKLLWGDLWRGKSGKGQRLLNLLPTLSQLSLASPLPGPVLGSPPCHFCCCSSCSSFALHSAKVQWSMCASSLPSCFHASPPGPLSLLAQWLGASGQHHLFIRWLTEP